MNSETKFLYQRPRTRILWLLCHYSTVPHWQGYYVHALKGLPCLACITPATLLASNCKQCLALTLPSLHTRNLIRHLRARWGHNFCTLRSQFLFLNGTNTKVPHGCCYDARGVHVFEFMSPYCRQHDLCLYVCVCCSRFKPRRLQSLRFVSVQPCVPLLTHHCSNIFSCWRQYHNMYLHCICWSHCAVGMAVCVLAPLLCYPPYISSGHWRDLCKRLCLHITHCNLQCEYCISDIACSLHVL